MENLNTKELVQKLITQMQKTDEALGEMKQIADRINRKYGEKAKND